MDKKRHLTSAIPLFFLITSGLSYLIFKNLQSKFQPPRQDAPIIQFTIGKNFTLDAIVGDLYYYGFIKDKEAFKFALKHSKDTTSGSENTLKIGNNTLNLEAVYKISQNMTAWQLAEVLLNQGDNQSCNHGCPESNFIPELLPGGDLAPTIKEKYSWVKSYQDCVNAIGHDGGQLSSQQYYQKTGIKRCVSPDGREFTQGKEGWSDTISP